MQDVTRLLNEIEQGRPGAADLLLPLIYDELRALAKAKLSNERPGHTLQATALVHEAFLRLAGDEARNAQQWDGRGHFFSAAARAMQRILVENARHKQRIKAGSGRDRVDLDQVEPELAGPDIDLLALDDALEELERKDKRKADLVRLRFFAGLTVTEAAAALGISTSTADNDWAYAKNWLRLEINGDR